MKSGLEAEPLQSVYSEADGYRFAGTHLLLEFWDAIHLDDPAHAERALVEAAEGCGATVLNVMTHHFSPQGGVSGVVVLQESHISIHTWPEFGYAALDIFTCGTVDPHDAIPFLRKAFAPERIQMSAHRRGMML